MFRVRSAHSGNRNVAQMQGLIDQPDAIPVIGNLTHGGVDRTSNVVASLFVRVLDGFHFRRHVPTQGTGRDVRRAAAGHEAHHQDDGGDTALQPGLDHFDHLAKRTW